MKTSREMHMGWYCPTDELGWEVPFLHSSYFTSGLELGEEMPQVMYARMFQKTRPEIGAAEAEICGGHVIFAGLGSPIGRATGVGLDRPFTAEDLNRVEEFYRAHQAPA